MTILPNEHQKSLLINISERELLGVWRVFSRSLLRLLFQLSRDAPMQWHWKIVEVYTGAILQNVLIHNTTAVMCIS